MSLHLNEPEQPTPDAQLSTGAEIFYGLLLTIILHFLQLLLVPLAMANEKAGFIAFSVFGFTQLFYMLPTILFFHRRNERGMTIGLIIGASITFVLGLPFAGWGYICATQPKWP